MSVDDLIATTATRHNLSPNGVRALAEALGRGGGRLAQWSHPDLGGMGQWSGGMIQIGDMFNNGLKARVAAALDDLSRAGPMLFEAPAKDAPAGFSGAPSDWWPGDLGRPSSTGSQNDMRYAFFPEARRLAVQRNGKVTVYDTGSHQLNGFSQAQSGTQTLEFSGSGGRMTLADLAIVG